jgi:hypothetical protein
MLRAAGRRQDAISPALCQLGCGRALPARSAVVFYTPPVVVTSPGRLPNDIERLRGKLRDFCLEEIRFEEQPRLESANREVEALYEYHRRTGLNGFDVPPEEVARRQDEWRRIFEGVSGRERAQPDPTALILIDEADRLKMTGLEQMRAIFDHGRAGPHAGTEREGVTHLGAM